MDQFEGCGKALRLLRERSGLRQGELADQAGTTSGVLNTWENDRSTPRLQGVDSVLEALGADLLNFLEALDAVNGRPRFHAGRIETTPEGVRARIIEIFGLDDLPAEKVERFLTCLQSLHAAFRTVGVLTKLEDVG